MSTGFVNLRYEQFAGSNFHYIKHTLEHFLRSMEELDVHLVEFYMTCPHYNAWAATTEDAKKLKGQLAQREIKLCCTTFEQCTYPVNIASEDDTYRRQSIALLEQVIAHTAELECPYTQVLGGRGSYDLPPEEAWKRAADSFSALAKTAERYGVTMVIEEASWFTTNTVYTTPLTRKMLDEVNNPHLKAMLDNCATETAGEDFSECLALLGPDMRHMHFADGTPGGHFIPGEGALVLEKYLHTLDDFGYTGAITFELYNRKYELEPHKYMQSCFDYAKQFYR